MGRARDEAGNIWETDAQGKAVRLITAAQGGGMQPPPLRQRQVQGDIAGQAAQTGRTVVQTEGDRTDNYVKSQSAEAQIAKARADAARAQAEAAAAQRATNNPTMSDDQRKAAMQGANLDALVGQINRVQDLYNQNVAGASPFEWLPGRPDMAQFNAAAAGLAEQGLSAFRTPGVGSQSDAELRQFVEANKPHSSSLDSANEERLRQLRARTDSARRALGLSPAQWGPSGGGVGGMVGGMLSSPPRKSRPPKANERGWWGEGVPRKQSSRVVDWNELP